MNSFSSYVIQMNIFSLYEHLSSYLVHMNIFSLYEHLSSYEVHMNILVHMKFIQTWKKARTRGQCPRKFSGIAEIFGLLKIIHLYFRINLKNCGNI